MAALTTHKLVGAGTAPSFVAASAGGDTAEVGSGRDTFLVVKNANAGATRTVTIASDITLESGDAYPDKAVTVPISGEVWIPLIKDFLDDANPGRASFTYSSEADLTVAVVRR